MIDAYDPETSPDPALWLATDELELEDVIMQYCMANEADLPDVYMHAHFHMTVENQVAMGDEIPVAGEFRRLMADGLSRHEAVHAVGWVLSKHMFGIVRNKEKGTDLDLKYYEKLKNFTVAQWHEEAAEAEEETDI
jgi:hypothetical protein